MSKVAVLMGGKSAEREVSLTSGTAVADALEARGHEVVRIDAADRLADALAKAAADVVFIALHGRWGEDGTVQGMLEMLEMPYTGSGVLASAVAMDKGLSKTLFAAHDVPTPAWQLLGPGQGADGVMLSPPFVIKPPCEGSTLGIEIVRSADELDDALSVARRYDDAALIEAFVEGRELTVGVVDGHALPIVEIEPEGGFYDYNAKYTPGSTRYTCPAALTEAQAAAVTRAGVRAYEVLGCAGAARVDVMLDDQDNPWVLEANTIPGMTPTSLLPKAAAAHGMDFEMLVETILRGASLKA